MLANHVNVGELKHQNEENVAEIREKSITDFLTSII
jgi:hypothetical protein